MRTLLLAVLLADKLSDTDSTDSIIFLILLAVSILLLVNMAREVARKEIEKAFAASEPADTPLCVICGRTKLQHEHPLPWWNLKHNFTLRWESEPK